MFKGVLSIWENHNIPAITGCQHYTYDIQYLQQNDEYLQDLLSNIRKYSFLGALVVTSEEKKRTNIVSGKISEYCFFVNNRITNCRDSINMIKYH